MVFRRDSNKIDSFQRQMSSLREQIGGEEQEDETNAPDQRDRFAQSGERGRQLRPSSDEGYSFGSLTSANPAHGQGEDADFDDSVAIPEMPQPNQEVTQIADGSTFKGDLDAQGSVHVYGKLNGSITATDDVWIAEGAEVDARIEADRVVIGGEIEGHIAARSRFEALPGCELAGDVEAPTFIVHEGATLNGSLKMGATSGPPSSDLQNTRGRSGSIIQRRTRTSS